MTKNVKIAIAIGSGLAVGFGGWYLYQYMQKRNEAAKLAGSTPPDAPKPAPTPAPTPVTTPVYEPTPAPIYLSGHKPLKFNPKLEQQVATADQSQNTASSFNGQEMVTRYQRPFWTVGG